MKPTHHWGLAGPACHRQLPPELAAFTSFHEASWRIGLGKCWGPFKTESPRETSRRRGLETELKSAICCRELEQPRAGRASGRAAAAPEVAPSWGRGKAPRTDGDRGPRVDVGLLLPLCCLQCLHHIPCKALGSGMRRACTRVLWRLGHQNAP